MFRFKTKQKRILIKLDKLMTEMASDDIFDEYIEVIEVFATQVLAAEGGRK